MHRWANAFVCSVQQFDELRAHCPHITDILLRPCCTIATTPGRAGHVNCQDKKGGWHTEGEELLCLTQQWTQDWFAQWAYTPSWCSSHSSCQPMHSGQEEWPVPSRSLYVYPQWASSKSGRGSKAKSSKSRRWQNLSNDLSTSQQEIQTFRIKPQILFLE